MAKRKASGRFFVYVVRDGAIPLYVGKGCGHRHKASARKHGGTPEIIERFDTDDEAFERERFWIAELRPTCNLHPGGNGGRSAPRSAWEVPPSLRGRVTKAAWQAAVRETQAIEAEIDRIGSQKYCARLLLSRLDDANCEQWGVSKVEMNRLREVARG